MLQKSKDFTLYFLAKYKIWKKYLKKSRKVYLLIYFLIKNFKSTFEKYQKTLKESFTFSIDEKIFTFPLKNELIKEIIKKD